MVVPDRKVSALQLARERYYQSIPSPCSLDWRSPFAIIGLAVAMTVISAARLFGATYFPLIDTGWSYEFFSYALEQIRTTGRPPFWLPNVAYGLSDGFFWLTAIGPSQYAFLLIGKLTHFSALNLFVMSMAIDQFFFFLGVVLVSQKLFADRALVFLYVVIASGLILVIDNQIFWNFRIFQMLPLAIFFLILAVERSRMIFAATAMLTLVTFSFGSLTYTLPFQVYTLLLFFAVLVMLQAEPLKKMSSLLLSALEPVNIGVAFAALALLGAVVLFSYNIQTQLAYIGPGREHGLRTDLSEYLTWGHYTDVSKFVELTTAQPINDGMDFTSFFGAAGLVLLIYAALVEKSPIFRSFLIVLLWIVGFSMAASGIAHIAYYLPGMNYFRHIGYVAGSIKWIAVIAAAYGLMSLATGPTHTLRLLIAINISIGLLVCSEFWYLVNMFHSHEWAIRHEVLLWTPRFHVLTAAALFLMLCGTLFGFLFEKTWLCQFVFVIALGELLGYRVALNYRYPAGTDSRTLFANAAPLTYQSQRIWPFEAPKLQRLEAIGNSPVHYDIDAGFTDIDLCGSDADALFNASNLVMPRVRDLFETWQNGVKAMLRNGDLDAGGGSRPGRLRGNDRDVLLAALGCHAAKMRLVSDPIFAANDQAARELISQHPNIFDRPVVLGSQDEDSGRQRSQSAGAPDDGTIEISEFSADAIAATVTNPANKDLWLVYADAFAPDWTASIDGRRQAVLRANLAFKAIPIPPGRHEVRFEFSRGLLNMIVFPGGVALFVLMAFISGFALSNRSNEKSL